MKSKQPPQQRRQRLPVLHDDQVAATPDHHVARRHRQLDHLSVHVDTTVRHHLELRTSAHHGDTLAHDVVSRSGVVHDDTKLSVDEVSRQQVAALAGKLEETLVERHQMLIAGDACVGCMR